jgi:quercetin dioxygenase-like cupin family protein
MSAEETGSRVIAGLAAELPIPTSATTSRVVVNTPDVRVVAFAMDAGQELTDHASPFPVVVVMGEGTMQFTTMGIDHLLKPGDVVSLAPNERHALLATQPCRFVLCLLRGAGSAATPKARETAG